MLIEVRIAQVLSAFCWGNHEQMFLDFLSGADPSLFLLNGGTETLNSYQNERLWPIPEAHRMFLENLDYSFETDDFIFVHAGLRPGLPLSEQSQEDLLWIRQEFLTSEYDDLKKSILIGAFATALIGLKLLETLSFVYVMILNCLVIKIKALLEISFSERFFIKSLNQY